MKTYKYTDVTNTAIEEFDTVTLMFRFIPVDLNNPDFAAISGVVTINPADPLVPTSDTDITHLVLKGGAVDTWTNMPAAATFYGGNIGMIQSVDTTSKTEARIIHVRGAAAGSANSRLFLRYNSTFSTTATNFVGMGGLDPTFGTPFVTVSSTNSVEDSGWQPLNPAARDEIYIAVVGSGGNGAADPTFGSIVALFR